MSSALDMKFTGDAAQVERIFEKMKKMQQELLTLSQRISQESRDQTNKDKSNYDIVAAAQEGVIGGLGKMAAGYLTVNQLVNVISKSYEHMIEKQREAAKQASETNNSIIAATSATGDLLQSDAVLAFAKQATASKQATQAQAVEIFRNVAEAIPGASMDRKLEISRSILPQVPVISERELPDYARAVGGLARDFGGAYSGGELADIALKARGLAGNRFNEFKDRDFSKGVYKLAESGAMSNEQALAFATSAMLNSQEPGFIERMANRLYDKLDIKQATATSPLSKDDRMLNRLARMDPGQRLEAISGNQEMTRVLLGSDVMNFRQSMKDFERMTKEIQAAAAPGSFTNEYLQQAQKTKVVSERSASVAIDAGQSAATAQNADRATVIRNATNFYNQQVEKSDMNFLMKWFYTQSESTTDLESRVNNHNLSQIAKSAFPSFLLDEGESRGRDNLKLKEYYEYLDQQNTAIQAGLPETNWASSVGLEQLTQAANVMLEAAKLMMQNEQSKPKAEPTQPKPVNVNVRGDVEGR